jgi:hypothetical protein
VVPSEHFPALEPAPLSELSVTPRLHFQAHYYIAVYALLRFLHRLEQPDAPGGGWLDRFVFLRHYAEEMRHYGAPSGPEMEGLSDWLEDVGRWERETDVRLPLRSLVDEGGFFPVDRIVMLMAGLVEEDARFGSVFSELQAPLGARRPTLELIGRIFMEDTQAPDPWAVCRGLLEGGYLEAVNPDAPRSEWILRVPTLLWDALRDQVRGDGFSLKRRDAFSELEDVVVPEAVRTQLLRAGDLLLRGEISALVIRGQEGSDRLAAVGAVARRIGRDLMTLEGEGVHAGVVGPLCVLTGAMPVVRYSLAPGEKAVLPTWTGYQGPAGVITGLVGGIAGDVLERSVSITLPLPTRHERRQYWEQAFSGMRCRDLDAITERFHLPSEYIRKVAAGACRRAAVEGRSDVRLADVRLARRDLGTQLLDTLAEHLPVDEELADDAEGSLFTHLIVADGTRHKLNELEQRCHHRERLLEHLGPGFDAGRNRGVRALFAGPSGTGKTLAAKLLAASLGIDIYRVDLAAVVNKYIGETEKNLHRVLSAAEELDVILLLDEGDALLGTRTDVKTSNDRYANLETNYLLQRLEHHQGIVLVTTNLGDNIDKAFQRRMDVVVDFLPPRAEERLLIWRLHLPAEHRVDDEFLSRQVVHCELNGGQIRNAAQLATLLALNDGRKLCHEHLEAALRGEFRKAGATYPLEDVRSATESERNLSAFLHTIK